MSRYTITMRTTNADGVGRLLRLEGRTVRYVAFQNADGSYPANAHEVTSDTYAVCYSTSSKDKRGYIGSYLVGNVPEIHNEIDARQKATAWMVATPAEVDEAKSSDEHEAYAMVELETAQVRNCRNCGQVIAITRVLRGDVLCIPCWTEETKAAQLAYLKSIPGRQQEIPATAKEPFTPADEAVRDTRELATALHSRGPWKPEHCHEVPPVQGCWCAVTGLPEYGEPIIAATDATDDMMADYSAHSGWTEDMCRVAVSDLCYSTGVTRPSCCGALLCSRHAREAAEDSCPNCGSLMSSALAAFDTAEEIRRSQPIERVPGVDGSPATWASDAWVSDGCVLSVTRPEAPATPPTWPRYGVAVEWWDDDRGVSVAAVIGSHETWEIAIEEMKRLKRLDRFDRITGTIALYGSDSDV